MLCEVYIARGGTSGLFKIGATRAATARIHTLAAAVREDIELLAVMRGSYAEEYALHRRFARLVAHDACRGREWFRDDGTIAAFIASLPARARGSHTRRYGGRLHRVRHDYRNTPAFVLTGRHVDAGEALAAFDRARAEVA